MQLQCVAIRSITVHDKACYYLSMQSSLLMHRSSDCETEYFSTKENDNKLSSADPLCYISLNDS